MDLGIPVKYAAPFSTSSGAAEKFIKTGEPSDLKKKIRRSYNYLNSKYKYVVVEGTGHPGVGSVFNLSNADVASMLDIPVVLVLNGGIGSTIDRFSLCVEPFRSRKVKLLGVIINKVLPEKMDKVNRYCPNGLDHEESRSLDMYHILIHYRHLLSEYSAGRWEQKSFI